MRARLLIFSLLLASSALGKIINPSLYRISKPGSEAQASYILGTLHSIIQMDEFEVSLRGMIYRSRVVLTELALTPEEVALFSTQPYAAFARHTDTTVRVGDLSPETRQKLTDLGLPEKIISSLRDRDCGILYGIQFARSKNLPLDLEITRSAHLFQVPLEALDSIELRNEAKRKSAEKSNGGLSCSLNHVLTASDGESILTALAADLQNIADRYRLGKRIDPASDQNPLSTVRNQAWLPKIETAINAGGTFIAVGQSHLYGKLGLLSLLKSRGYRIQRVSKNQ